MEAQRKPWRPQAWGSRANKISLPFWQSGCFPVKHSCPRACLLPLSCKAFYWKRGSGMRDCETAFYTTCNNVCIDNRGLTEVREPSWFGKNCLFYYSHNFTCRVLEQGPGCWDNILSQPPYQLQRNWQPSGQLDMVTSDTCKKGERC